MDHYLAKIKQPGYEWEYLYFAPKTSRWRRAVGTIHDLDGVATCGACLERTAKAWTDGDNVLCGECYNS